MRKLYALPFSLAFYCHATAGAKILRLIGQASLPETCPVCAHHPITPDLCKPNKALRTTLKAFLRTEEKKRERERASAAPATPAAAPSAEDTPAHQEPTTAVEAPEESHAKGPSETVPVATSEKTEGPAIEGEKPETTVPVHDDATENATGADHPAPSENQTQVSCVLAFALKEWRS